MQQKNEQKLLKKLFIKDYHIVVTEESGLMSQKTRLMKYVMKYIDCSIWNGKRQAVYLKQRKDDNIKN